MTDQLDLLAEMGRDFAASGDIEALLKTGLERIAATLDAEGGALFMLNAEGDALVCHASHGPVDISGLEVGAGEGIVGRAVENNRSEMVRDVSKDPSFKQSIDDGSGFTTRSILCAPLSVKEQRIGAIEVVNKKGGDSLFTDSDLQLLETLAASAGLAILNARMAEELIEKEKMRRELELAGEIQKSLLPVDGPPDHPVAGVNLPARVVSGDFYDFFDLEDGRICFTLADVSGKGMNAALLMAKTASLFRCLGKETPHPGRLLSRINAEINETAARGMFVTMLAGIYDPETGRVRFANAGHEPPLFHTAQGKFEDFEATMPPVGILPDLGMGKIPEEQELQLNGGAFYVFTDGVTEGYVNGEELGSVGFREKIVEGKDSTPLDRVKSVAQCLKDEGPTLRDDVTILVVDDGRAARIRAAGGGDNARNGEDALADDLHTGSHELATISVAAVAESLKMVRRVVEVAATSCGYGKETTQDIVLAVDEACQNVVRHAYRDTNGGEMVIAIVRDKGDFVINIRDFAPKVDPSVINPRALDDIRPGGLGTHFIAQVMDSVEFTDPPDGPGETKGNLLVLKKAL